jgi:hypothetical protein
LAEYFLKLAENSKAKAEKDFGEKYGKAELNVLLNVSQEQPPKKNYLPLIIGGGLIVLGIIGGLVVYFGRKPKKSKIKSGH